MPNVSPFKQLRETNDTQARAGLLLGLIHSVKRMAFSLTEVAEKYFEEKATDVVFILDHLAYSLEELRSIIKPLKICQDDTICIVHACKNRL